MATIAPATSSAAIESKATFPVVLTFSNLVVLAHLAPAMAGRGAGHVTAIASLAGLVGMPFEAPYSASKAALASIVQMSRAPSSGHMESRSPPCSQAS